MYNLYQTPSYTRRLYLCSVYRPPTGNVQNYIDTIDNCVKFLPHIDKSDLFVGGDFNINFHKPRQENTKKLKSFATQHQLTQLIKDSTRPLSSDAIKALIFSNCQHIDSSGSLDWNVSDHIPVYVNIKKSKTKSEKAEFRGRSYRHFVEESFLLCINNKDWNEFGINDLVLNIHHCKFFLYADDIVMFKSIGKNSVNNDIDLFKRDLAAIEYWCLKNELTFNIKKTKLQFFQENRNIDCNLFENEVKCQIYNQTLEYENTFKYLGVDIDRYLTMKSFFDSMYKLVNHKLYLLKLIRPSLTVEAALAVGKSMILSLIDYGNIYLTSLTQKDQEDLQKLQNKVLRCC